MKRFSFDSICMIGSFLIYILGGIDNLLITFFGMMIIDYITGILSAIYSKKLNSKIGVKGIIKKFAYLCIIASTVLLDKMLNSDNTIRTVIIYFFVANEGLSIVENLGKMKIQLPKKLIDVFEQLKKEE